MNKNKTIKNWKWWALMPVATIIFPIILIPKFIIFLLELLIAAIELLNYTDKPNKTAEKILNWAHKGK